jgi:hypothetical protein
METKGKAMPDLFSHTFVGALVGSGLSAWWRKAMRWQVNFAAGVFIGWWGGDWLILVMQWPATIEMSRAVGAALGLIGFSLLDGVLRVPWGDMVGKVAARAAERANK